MKKLKIKFVDWWYGFNERNNFITNILEKHFELEFSENPDFIFCSPWSLTRYFSYLEYDCPRIMYSGGEDIFPDFNAFDYWIGFDPIEFKHESPFNNMNCNKRVERFFQFNEGFHQIVINQELNNKLTGPRSFTKEDLARKKEFCALITGHESYTEKRAEIFNALSKYRNITSAGRFLNNMPDGRTISRTEKFDFLKDFKFSIAIESPSIDGFITEKLPEAFTSTVPIYFGTNYATKYYNKNAFINVHDFNSIDELVDKVIEIDNNDDLYCKMMSEPVFIEKNMIEKINNEFETWLISVVSQNKNDVYKRPNIMYINDQLKKDFSIYSGVEINLKSLISLNNNKLVSTLRKFKNLPRKIFKKK